ncbi:MAG: RNA 2'-phosphotransferase [Thermoplasmata archaeon]|jgi:putative RNA 2'-phosphotransferase|nr:MAG: RNA 2'-phosphotransferase [Aciduliprofundum sp.]
MKLKYCEAHGPFRGEKCPICGADGKLILNDWELEALSKIITGILRHFPEKFNVSLDEHGWAKISDISLGIRNKERKFRWLKDYHVEYFIITDPKGRFQMDPEKKSVRAVYGHSIDVDLSDLPRDGIPPKLYYSIDKEEEEFINEIGIRAGERRWVHLSKTYEEAYIAGLHKTDDPVVLEINTEEAMKDGIEFYRATKTIYITKEIPPKYIKKARKRKVEVPEEELKEIELEKKRKEERERRRKEREERIEEGR